MTRRRNGLQPLRTKRDCFGGLFMLCSAGSYGCRLFLIVGRDEARASVAGKARGWRWRLPESAELKVRYFTAALNFLNFRRSGAARI